MKLTVIQGDITKVQADAIVNAANSSLLGGGGVDGAIHRAGGPAILEECRNIRNRQGGCATGEAVITTGGNLPARYVIHTVGPVWNGGKSNELTLLKTCYLNSLQLAEENGVTSIAFPNISTGIYRFPKDVACKLAIEAASAFESTTLRTLTFVCFDAENYALYKAQLKL